MSGKHPIVKALWWIRAKYPYVYAHPLAFVLSVTAVILGLVLLPIWGPGVQETVVGGTPIYTQWLWLVLLIAGGGLTSAGMLREKQAVMSEPLEGAGNVCLSACGVIFGISVLYFRGWEVGAVTGTMFIAAGLGFLIRALIVYVEARTQRKVVESIANHD